jgi:hypothetical protein
MPARSAAEPENSQTRSTALGSGSLCDGSEQKSTNSSKPPSSGPPSAETVSSRETGSDSAESDVPAVFGRHVGRNLRTVGPSSNTVKPFVAVSGGLVLAAKWHS